MFPTSNSAVVTLPPFNVLELPKATTTINPSPPNPRLQQYLSTITRRRVSSKMALHLALSPLYFSLRPQVLPDGETAEEKKAKIDKMTKSMLGSIPSSPELEGELENPAELVHCWHHDHGQFIESRAE
ncbi:hypothetical protein IFM47457_06939 [Aspergillus lentulus]|nr:hypothetical protein IFM47457_06939 [Aspergillus lentulus]